MRVVTLGNGKTVSLKAYCNAVKTAKANLDVEFKYGLTGWWPVTGREIVHQFIRGLENRINEKIAYSTRGVLHESLLMSKE